jgi:F-type H+-transporting ATPase subunit epsilon
MFKLNFVTPEAKVVFDQEIEKVTVPTVGGYLELLPNHSPLLTIVEPGIVSYQMKNSESHKIAVSSGYCEVSTEGVNILVENITSAVDVKDEDNLKQISFLEEKLAKIHLNDKEWKKTKREIGFLRAELEIVNDKKH